MSQKVNPHALRSQQSSGNLAARQSASSHEIFFSEPKKSKWGLTSYTRIFHEDQSIETYLEGFFKSFGFYQQTCVIERKCNNKIHITSYVLRTPQVRMKPTVIWATPKEKVLQEGLDGSNAWIPSLLLQTIAKILTSTTDSTTPIVPSKKAGSTKNATSKVPTTGKWSDVITTTSGNLVTISSITSSNGDNNSLLQQQTEEVRFKKFMSHHMALQHLLVVVPTSSEPPTSSWWSHRTWHSKVLTGKVANVSPASFDLSVSIVPVQSLATSSKLVADYMADKIEQSAPLQGLFQEISQCLESYSNFQSKGVEDETSGGTTNLSSEWQTTSDTKTPTVGTADTKPIVGFRLSCSGRLQKNAYAKPAEMADIFTITRGVLPLNSFKHDIEYTQTSSTNAFGTCGIKVWINRGCAPTSK